MKTTQRLFESVKEIWSRYDVHPFVTGLRDGTLDRLSTDYSEAQLRHLEEIFITCSRYELAFWQMAWDMRL